ncbi:hypothetical protein [Burkholderia dolosa]|uniref:hypothetical protein n=1 Tax=Burkholderia dolosa TaxID=152500 RepID=UPI001B9C1015|nr:hypothetical protein [Burkholderia dolosa]MBR8061004.1 hypothetical protein [Burkholderia dolosa]
MKQSRVVSVAVAVTASLGLLSTAAPTAFAQDAASAPTQKQLDKAQKKAARKAARAKRDKDLNAIGHDGYRLTGDQSNYPQNAAQKPAATNTAPAAPASAQ